MRKYILAALLCWGCFPAVAYANNCINIEYEPLAWHKYGSKVIIKKNLHSPKGGGANVYMVSDLKGRGAKEYMIFSNYNDERNTRAPSIISIEQCNQIIATVNGLLRRLRFQSVFKSSCAGNKPGDMLIVHDQKGRPLHSEALKEMAPKLGLSDVFGRTSHLSGMTANGIDFIIMEKNSSCDAQCHAYTYDKKEDTYERIGNCAFQNALDANR